MVIIWLWPSIDEFKFLVLLSLIINIYPILFDDSNVILNDDIYLHLCIIHDCVMQGSFSQLDDTNVLRKKLKIDCLYDNCLLYAASGGIFTTATFSIFGP